MDPARWGDDHCILVYTRHSRLHRWPHSHSYLSSFAEHHRGFWPSRRRNIYLDIQMYNEKNTRNSITPELLGDILIQWLHWAKPNSGPINEPLGHGASHPLPPCGQTGDPYNLPSYLKLTCQESNTQCMGDRQVWSDLQLFVWSDFREGRYNSGKLGECKLNWPI